MILLYFIKLTGFIITSTDVFLFLCGTFFKNFLFVWLFRSLGAGNSRIKVSADGTLEIGVVRASDAGVYTCSVSSPGGSERRHAHLSILELPYPPNVAQAERVGARAVNVSWTVGFDGNSPILKYIVQKRQIGEYKYLNSVKVVDFN